MLGGLCNIPALPGSRQPSPPAAGRRLTVLTCFKSDSFKLITAGGASDVLVSDCLRNTVEAEVVCASAQ